MRLYIKKNVGHTSNPAYYFSIVIFVEVCEIYTT